jgi:hypothetical protein
MFLSKQNNNNNQVSVIMVSQVHTYPQIHWDAYKNHAVFYVLIIPQQSGLSEEDLTFLLVDSLV